MGGQTHGVIEGLLPLLTPVDDIKLLENNPRRGDIDAVARSLSAFGQRKPVVVNRRTSEVLAGNHTLQAAKLLGWDALAAVYVDDDPQTAGAYAIADNRTGDLARWDEEMLAELMAEVDDRTLLNSASFSDADISRLLAQVTDTSAPSVLTYSDDEIVDDAVDYWLARGFPYPERLPLHEAKAIIRRLVDTPTDELMSSVTGYAVADGYQQHRYDVPAGSGTTAPSVWGDSSKLRAMLASALSGPLARGSGSLPRLTSADVRGVAGMWRGAQIAYNFRPGFALSIYRQHGVEGGSVLDTSAGFGGRLVGFLASPLSRYVGVDPAELTQKQNREMADDLAIDGKTVELVTSPAEDVDPQRWAGEFDLAFTSPPYFTKERYADEPTQSWVRYGSDFDAWVDGFLAPMLKLQHESLKPGGVSVINVADVDGHPLVEATRRSAEHAGFTIASEHAYKLNRVANAAKTREKGEAVIVLSKQLV